MRKSIMIASVAAAVTLAPRLASAAGVVEGFYGLAHPPATDFHAAVSGTASQPDLFKSSLQIAGGDLLLNFNWFEVGAIGDVSWRSGSATQTALGGLVGAKLPVGPFRIDALGEIGGHMYGNFSNVSTSKSSQWLMYVGLRPGFAYTFGADGRGFMIGVWGYARWDVTNQNVPVTAVSGTPINGEYKLGGTSIGATLRAGFAF
jgi:hypothetical protein